MIAINITAQVFRRYDPDHPELYARSLYRGEGPIIMSLILFGIFGPFVLQPIIDWLAMPAIGYEFCEALSSYGPTFGFPTYAYVPEPGMCAVP